MDHLQHLELMFKLFNDMNIALKGSKSFLGYSLITLLGQKVDRMGLITLEEKLAAISDLAFPETLKDLEVYLGLTGYMRDYVPLYSLIV